MEGMEMELDIYPDFSYTVGYKYRYPQKREAWHILDGSRRDYIYAMNIRTERDELLDGIT